MPESYIHSDTKIDLYWSLIQDDFYAYPEKSIGRTRTDILTDVNGYSVAIEIQHTRIPLKSILRRMREHAEIGAYTLWLITPDALVYGERVRNLNWVMFIQQLQGGMIFLPSVNQMVIPARVDNTLMFYKDEIVAGKRKFLDQQSPIEISELKFEKNEGLGVNVATWDEWWIAAGVD